MRKLIVHLTLILAIAFMPTADIVGQIGPMMTESYKTTLSNGATFDGSRTKVNGKVIYHTGRVTFPDGSWINGQYGPDLAINGQYQLFSNGKTYNARYSNGRLVSKQAAQSYGGGSINAAPVNNNSGNRTSSYSNPASSRTCPICNGAKTCRQCNGTGRRTVSTRNGNHVTTCGVCHGTGRCTQCHGSGKVR